MSGTRRRAGKRLRLLEHFSCFPRTTRHDEGVFRRFAAEAAGGVRPRGGQPARTGQAVWGECPLGVEDIPPAEADGPDGTDRAASGAAQRIPAEVQGKIRRLVKQQPDATLVELHQRLWANERIRISFQHLWRVLHRMGLRLKKVAPCPRARYRGHPSPTSSVVGGGKPDRSPRAGVSRRKRRDHGNDAALWPSSAR